MIHITYSKKLMTKDYIDIYKEELELFKPTCNKCNKELTEGDFIDGYFPYETEYNICKECVGD